MKNYILLSMTISALLWGQACSKETPKPDNDLPEWDKTKTLEITYTGTLSDQPLFTNTGQATSIAQELKKLPASTVCLLDAVEVDFSSEVNYLSTVARHSLRTCSFASRSYGTNSVRGCGILPSHSLISQEVKEVSPTCNLKLISLNGVGSSTFTLSNFSITRAEEVEKVIAASAVTIQSGGVIVATIKTELYPQMEAGLKKGGFDYRLSRVETISGDYALFVLTSKKRVLRQSDICNWPHGKSVSLKVEFL